MKSIKRTSSTSPLGWSKRHTSCRSVEERERERDRAVPAAVNSPSGTGPQYSAVQNRALESTHEASTDMFDNRSYFDPRAMDLTFFENSPQSDAVSSSLPALSSGGGSLSDLNHPFGSNDPVLLANSIEDLDFGSQFLNKDIPMYNGFEDDLATHDFNFTALDAALNQGDFLSYIDNISTTDTTAPSQSTHTTPSSYDSLPSMSSLSPPPSNTLIQPHNHQSQTANILPRSQTQQAPKSCTSTQKTCLQNALLILQTLHVPQTACINTPTLPSPSVPRKSDSVFSTNRQTISSLSTILHCPSGCASNSQVQLLLTIICSKLIAWYRAITRPYPEKCSPSGKSPVIAMTGTTSSTQGSSDEHENERVSHQPITVGGYSFDTSLERKIRAQIVLSELKYLEDVVESLEKRIDDEKGNGGNNAGEESGKAIRDGLALFLRKGLGEIKEEILVGLGEGKEKSKMGFWGSR